MTVFSQKLVINLKLKKFVRLLEMNQPAKPLIVAFILVVSIGYSEALFGYFLDSIFSFFDHVQMCKCSNTQ